MAIARRAVDLRRRRGGSRLARALLVLADSELDNEQLDNGQFEQARQHVDEALESVRDETTRLTGRLAAALEQQILSRATVTASSTTAGPR